jgi:hypothetical protein
VARPGDGTAPLDDGPWHVRVVLLPPDHDAGGARTSMPPRLGAAWETGWSKHGVDVLLGEEHKAAVLASPTVVRARRRASAGAWATRG